MMKTKNYGIIQLEQNVFLTFIYENYRHKKNNYDV